MFARPLNLSPSASLAVDQLESVFPLIRPHTLTSTIRSWDGLFVEDALFFVADKVKFSDLPRGQWLWSLADVTYHTQDSTGCMEVLFYPVLLRKSNQDHKMQSVSLWIYNITVPALKREVTVFWCQRGIPSPTLSRHPFSVRPEHSIPSGVVN